MVIHIQLSQQINKPQQIASEIECSATLHLHFNSSGRAESSSAEDSTMLEQEGWRILLLKMYYFALTYHFHLHGLNNHYSLAVLQSQWSYCLIVRSWKNWILLDLQPASLNHLQQFYSSLKQKIIQLTQALYKNIANNATKLILHQGFTHFLQHSRQNYIVRI